MNKHLYSLDYLRAFASISVCFFHFGGRPDGLEEGNLLKIICKQGHLGVPVFFVISGFIIMYSLEKSGYTVTKLGTFLKKRIIRIEPPYVLSIALILLLNYLSTITPGYRGMPYHFDWIQILVHVGYLNAFLDYQWLNPVFWTLAVEFQFYGFIALAYPLFSHPNRIVSIVALAGFNALHWCSDYQLLFYHAAYFSLGIALCRYVVTRDRTFLFVSLIALGLIHTEFSYQESAVCLLAWGGVLMPLRKSWFSQFYGSISYSLYLLHIPIGGRLINLMQRFSLSEDTYAIGLLGIFIVMSAISYLYDQMVEKPCKELSQSISYHRSGKELISH